MDQKMQMIGDYLSGEYTSTQLSKMYEVSRKTIYKWIRRYESEGPSGLEEQSRAPRSHPNATPLEKAREIVATKLRHQKWGPKKVVAWLEEHHPEEQWPAASTAGKILKREGLVQTRKMKRRTPPYTEPFTECNRPNAVWSADFKGQFKTGDGKLCYPLTITDNNSRYLLCCRGLGRPTLEETQPWFKWLFKENGLPEAIRTDNGAPFASVGLGGLTKLSVWFIKLGIKPERIEPGHPEQNGRHERMHRSLKEATANPPQGNILDQQRAFDEFVPEYNFQRPHEALGQKTPASFYRPSLRPYPVKVPKVEYAHDVIVRKVRHNGEIKWKGKLIYVSEALAGEPLALKQMEEHLWEIRFSFYPLGVLNELIGRIMPPTNQRGRKKLPMFTVQSVTYVPD
jgi:transposase InsO family protein